MKKLSKNQKQILYIGGGALVLLLLYRWYQARQSSGGAVTQSVPSGTSAGTDTSYSQLAGTEQSDIAALQQSEQAHISDLTGQIAALSSKQQQDIAGATSSEQSDIATLTQGMSTSTGAIGQLQTAVENIPNQFLNAVSTIPAGATGPPGAAGPAGKQGVAGLAAGTIQAPTAASAAVKLGSAYLKAIGHSFHYYGSGTYQQVTSSGAVVPHGVTIHVPTGAPAINTWGPRTLAAGHQLPGHSYRY